MKKLKAMIEKLKHLLKSRATMAGAVQALAIKASGAMLMIFIFGLCARATSAQTFGGIAVWFNALSCLAVIGVFGQETLIVRSWSEYLGLNQLNLAAGAYRFGWTLVAMMGAIACAVVIVANDYLKVSLNGTDLVAACAFLCCQVALHYSSHSCRTLLGFRLSEVQRELTWRLVLLGGVAAYYFSGVTPTIFFAFAAAGMLLAIAIQTRATVRRLKAEVGASVPQFAIREWFRRSIDMCISSSVDAISQYAEVIILGFLVSPTAAAGYFVAARIANMFSMVASGLHTYTITYASRLHFSGEIAQLQGILRSVMTVASALIIPSYAMLAIFGHSVLRIFGPVYAAEYPTLMILATAGLVITLSGPASGILLMTGAERLCSRIALLAMALRMLTTIVLASRYGAIGAAMSWALVNTPVAVSLSLLCRKVCHVDPSALSVLAPQVRAAAGGVRSIVKVATQARDAA
jgi:O-antigen/teichoic acid export membrane protein